MKHWLYIVVCLLWTGCNNAPVIHVQTHCCKSMPSPRASAAVAVVGGDAYIFSGRNHEGYLNDLWVYHSITDTWSLVALTPLRRRVNAVAISYADAIYMGLGFAGTLNMDSSYLRDWWKYTPSTQQWEQLADFPSSCTAKAQPFVHGQRIYILYGSDGGFSRDIIYYDIPSNTWVSIADNDNQPLRAFGVTGAQIGERIFIGTGYNTHNLTQWWEVNPVSNRWMKHSDIPGKGRELSAAATSGEYIYLFGGRYMGGDLTGGEIFDTYMRYSSQTDKWEWCGTMPLGRSENMIAFTILGKCYFGLGEDEQGQLHNELYYIE